MTQTRNILIVSVAIVVFGILLALLVSQNTGSDNDEQASDEEVVETVVSDENEWNYSYVGLPDGVLISDPTIIDVWRQEENLAAMREHAWATWVAMTTDSGFVAPSGEAMPVWDTWYTPYDLYQNPPSSADDLGSAHDFNATAQHVGIHTDTRLESDLLGFNKFNQPYVDHIWSNNYETTEGLSAALDSCEDGAICAIENFPFNAVSTKPVFMPVSANGITIIPVWRGIYPTGTSENPSTTWTIDSTAGVGSETWLQCVAIDTTGTYNIGDEITGIDGGSNLSCTSASVVSMDDFYQLTIMADDLTKQGNEQGFQNINQLNAETNAIEETAVAAGDMAVFVAMHVSTREIDQWVWFTVWWSPTPDDGIQIPIQYMTTQDAIEDGAMYDNYPGGGADRPESLDGTIWENYVICTNYQYVSPAQGLNDPRNPDLTPEFCFNPYLEALFTQEQVAPMGGINTNCMACHGNANWDGDLGYTSAMYIPRNDPQFDGLLQTDFAWSISTYVATPEPPSSGG